MCAFADDQSAVLRSVRQKVDKALEAAEAWLCGILILMGPRLVCREFLAVGEGKVDCVEADDKIFGIVNLLESSDDTRLLTNSPCPLLVRCAYIL